jgi:hypothetical protein
MNANEWKKISDVFAKCIQLSGNERERLLASLAESDPGTASQVRQLLKLDEKNEFHEHSTLDQIPRVPENATVTATSPPGSVPVHREQVPSEPDGLPTAADRNPRPARFDWLRAQTTWFWVLQTASLIAFAAFVYAIVLLGRYGNLTEGWDWEAVPHGTSWKVISVDSGDPADSKLQPGDEVRAINGETRLGGTGLVVTMNSVPPGASYTIDLLRQGIPRQFTLTKPVTRAPRALGSIAAYLLVSGCFFVVAVLIGISKPDTRLTQIAYAALMSEALVLVRVLLYP